MSFLRGRQFNQLRITTYLLLAGICIMCQAFVMQPVETKPLTVYNGELAKYFVPPQLPEPFCNAEPKKKSATLNSKNKRIATAMKKAVALPSLINPVLGATKQSIISFYGDARDNGRKHEGIDIVAPKGTFVIAPTGGEIVSVSYNSLGGKVIWMKDPRLKRTYYFAHLDSQIVTKGMLVNRGDTLGTVGNTGNARRTRSHLHFGIYTKYEKGRKPVDYIRTKEQVIALFASK
jgi:murein DD-endopeptidase MepM/ murein hydrolase activator NlpD